MEEQEFLKGPGLLPRTTYLTAKETKLMETAYYNGRKVPVAYIGDSVYALYDGYYIVLRLNDHRNEQGEICLEPPVMNNLIAFIKNCQRIRESDERKESENLANTNDKEEG